MGTLGVSLGTMVANLSASKKGWEERWKEFSDWAEKGQQMKKELLFLVDEDTRSFNAIMNAFGLPKSNPDETAARKAAIQSATRFAIEVPFRVMEKSLASMELILAMAEHGNPNSASDAGVGALCGKAAVSGAYLNVRINAGSYDDKAWVSDILAKGAEIEQKAAAMQEQILRVVNEKI
jgi:glutamate formiminotransferase/formiminotetrahydrofolate cyclodeaminase